MKTKATLVNEMKKPFWKKNAVSVAVASAALIFISRGGVNAQSVDLLQKDFIAAKPVNNPTPEQGEYHIINRPASTIYLRQDVGSGDVLDLNPEVLYKAIQENWVKTTWDRGSSLLDIYKNENKDTFATGTCDRGIACVKVSAFGQPGKDVYRYSTTPWGVQNGELVKGVATYNGKITAKLNDVN